MLGAAKAIIGNLILIRSFVDGGEMSQVLQEIGDNHYNAAIRALEDLRGSAEPYREAESAITSLREAREIFIGRTTCRFLGLIDPLFSARISGYKGACATSVLIALCYQYLGDKILSNRYLEDAKVQFESYAQASMEDVQFAFMLAMSEGIIPAAHPDEVEERLEEERKELLSLSQRC